MNKQPKDERIYIRVTPEQKVVINQAAALSSLSVTAFIVQRSFEAAEKLMHSQQHMVLDADRWDAFVDALDQPPRRIDALVKLMTEPSILERDIVITPNSASEPTTFSAVLAMEQRLNHKALRQPSNQQYTRGAAVNRATRTEPRVA